jgi:hypothetical protein
VHRIEKHMREPFPQVSRIFIEVDVAADADGQ